MQSKIFLDTNIVLDILVPTRLYHSLHKELLYRLLDYDVYISEDMLSTIYYVTKNNQRTLHFFQIIMNEWNIVPFGKDVIEKAIAYTLENETDFEDALQCFCAKKYGCTKILTSDKKFVACGVEIVDYKQFLEGI